MIETNYKLQKTTQAACRFLKNNGGRMNYMKLIKFLYLADRKALEEWERPITGASYFSMDQGPVLSEVLQQIKNESDIGYGYSYWNNHISDPKNYRVSLKRDPGYDELSQKEKEIIDFICEEFKDYNHWDMKDYCHNELPEWKDPHGSSIPIDIEDILVHLGKTEDEIETIKNEINNLNYTREILGC